MLGFDEDIGVILAVPGQKGRSVVINVFGEVFSDKMVCLIG